MNIREIRELPELTDHDDIVGLVMTGESIHATHEGETCLISVAENAAGERFKVTSIFRTGLHSIFN